MIYLHAWHVLERLQEGKTALDWAQRRGHDDVVGLLEVRQRAPRPAAEGNSYIFQDSDVCVGLVIGNRLLRWVHS